MITHQALLFLLPLLLFAIVNHAQRRNQDRQPAVAGMFYPDGYEELKKVLSKLFAKAVGRKGSLDVAAIIVPHAGYVYSGEVAASGFNQLAPDKIYDNIFILGPSHRVGFEGAAVYCTGNFSTPLGTVEVNCKLGEKLTNNSPLFTARTDAHIAEHSVEVQVPFLQYYLKKPFRIVPIVLGSNSPDTCRMIAEMLLPFFKGNNLFVVSTDFSHYPDYDDAVRVDKAVAEAIISNSPDKLINTMHQYESANIPNLATTLCGVSGVLSLMYMTSARADISYVPIQYRNSGDTPIGDKRQVVGYHTIMVTKKEKGQGKKDLFRLTPKDKETLLGIARDTIASYVENHFTPEVEGKILNEVLRTPCGAFVTLKKDGQLRGCIGQFDAVAPLYKVVQEMAISAAFRDNRFRPVGASELEKITIEISVLTPMRKINSIDEFELGKQGIYIRKGLRTGTFLPQVAHDTGWSSEEFFGHCAREKVGIGWDGWKDAELYVYEAFVFGET